MSEPEGPPSTPPRIDQRVDPRFPIKAAITYFPFSSQRSFHGEGIVLNCSRFGLYFETSRPLKIGQYLCIRIQQIFEDRTTGESGHLKTLTLAQVRWCEERGAESESSFGVGVKYC